VARLDVVLGFIKEYLSEFKPIIVVSEHSYEEEREYINLRVVIEQLTVLIIIREYLVRGNVIAYGYYFRTRPMKNGGITDHTIQKYLRTPTINI
jgi:hypothetical protein